MRKWKSIGSVAVLGMACATLPARAAFTLFDNFNSYNVGPLSGQGGWTTSTNVGAQTNVVVADVAENDVQVYGNSIPNYKALGALTIPNANSSATVYFNFKMAAATTGNNFNFIVTDVPTPTDTAGTSEVQFNFDATQAPAGGTTTFRIRNGGAFLFTSTGGTVATELLPQANTLYNVWFVINNSADNYKVFMQSDGDPALANVTQILATDGTSTFGFRNGAAANDLITVNFGNGAVPQANAVNYDDVYVDLAGQNLVNPAPEPATFGIFAVAGVGALVRRRRA